MKKIVLSLSMLILSCSTMIYNHEETFNFSKYSKALLVVNCNTLGLYNYRQELIDHFRDQLNKTSEFTTIYDCLADTAMIDSLPDNCVKIFVEIESNNIPTEEINCVTESGEYWESTVCSGNLSIDLKVYCKTTNPQNGIVKDFHKDGDYKGSDKESLKDVIKGAYKDALNKVATEFSKKFSI